MAPFLYRCPNTAFRVQGLSTINGSENGGEVVYERVTCLACGQPHLVNPKTGKILGADNNE
jgi:hypothetical protein